MSEAKLKSGRESFIQKIILVIYRPDLLPVYILSVGDKKSMLFFVLKLRFVYSFFGELKLPTNW